MDKLILHPTETSQWYALVNEAQAAHDMQLAEDLESYLVFLLMRYVSQPRMMASVIATDWLESQQVTGQLQQELLQGVGDKSLLLSGLFPGVAKRRRVKVSYFIDVGRSAYGTLSSVNQLKQPAAADLFAELSQEFKQLMKILRSIRDINEPTGQQSIDDMEKSFADLEKLMQNKKH